MKIKIVSMKLILVSLLFLILTTPTFANSINCSQCSINQQCTCELKLDEGTCTDGLWIVLKSEGNPLQIQVVADIPPINISFTPTGEGKIKINGYCFSTPMPVILEKEINIKASFLQCPTTCKIGDSCSCSVNNCTDGLYVIINKVNNPVDYNIYPYLSTIATDPYINIFKAKENGTVGIVAACFSPLPTKSTTADIIIGGGQVQQCTTHQDCDDSNPCTSDICDSNGQCLNTPITACINSDGCCPSGCTSTNDNDCSPNPTEICNNGIDDDGDGCIDTVDSDCGGTETNCTDGIDNDCDGQIDGTDSDCSPTPTCSINSDCDDSNPCTSDICDSNGQCLNTPITACINSDGCCPSGCTSSNDNDCPTQCKFQLTSDSTLQDRPSLIYDGGNYYLAYQSWETGDSFNGDIFIKKFDSGWNELKKVRVTSESSYQDSPSLIIVNNTIYIAYVSNETGLWDIFVKQYNLDFNELKKKILTTNLSNQDLPSLIYDGGNYYLAYQSWETGDSFNGDIFIKKFDSGWNELKKVRVTSESSYQDRPSLRFIDGFYYIVYYSSEVGNYDIFIKRLGLNLNLDASFKKQITLDSSSQSFPSIYFNKNYVITYASNERGTLGIFMKTYDINWNFINKSLVIDDNSFHERRSNSIFNAPNSWVVYTANKLGNSDWNLFAIKI
ncbi:MAG: hypothetical protein KAT28_01435 [Candidatus Aenigmarchaeota archaeon]|nr:hypothetical protein [Candidatus Aenigmarchaeota archaeon]